MLQLLTLLVALIQAGSTAATPATVTSVDCGGTNAPACIRLNEALQGLGL